MSQPSPATDIDDLVGWYFSPTSRRLTFEATLDEACKRFNAAGGALWRVRILRLTNHPEVSGLVYEWRAEHGVTWHEVPHDIVDTAIFVGSPVELAQRTRAPVRVRLDVPEERNRFPHLADLVVEGATDYLAEPLFFLDGRVSCATAATRRPGGFTDEELGFFQRMLPMIAVRVEAHSQRHALESLLKTYLGRNAAQRVLAGAFRRGSGETIRAAIWFSDMRGFTKRSERVEARSLVQLLDRFFERIDDAIVANGGEVLKLVGDGALAVFPIEGDDARSACAAATSAARAALEGVRALSAELLASREDPVALGIGLHVGEVMYGNIGSRSRLDFTAIGAAVNAASRIEERTKAVGTTVLASSEFVRHVDGVGFESVGAHDLRGVGEPMELFTLAT
jgi:adenylate cyclase